MEAKQAQASVVLPAKADDGWDTTLADWLVIVSKTFRYTAEAAPGSPSYLAWVRVIRQYRITEVEFGRAVTMGPGDKLVQSSGMKPSDLVRITAAERRSNHEQYEPPAIPRDILGSSKLSQATKLFIAMLGWNKDRESNVTGYNGLIAMWEREGGSLAAKWVPHYRARLALYVEEHSVKEGKDVDA